MCHNNNNNNNIALWNGSCCCCCCCWGGRRGDKIVVVVVVMCSSAVGSLGFQYFSSLYQDERDAYCRLLRDRSAELVPTPVKPRRNWRGSSLFAMNKKDWIEMETNGAQPKQNKQTKKEDARVAIVDRDGKPRWIPRGLVGGVGARRHKVILNSLFSFWLPLFNVFFSSPCLCKRLFLFFCSYKKVRLI